MTTQPKFPGVPTVINGNGAVAHVMKHVCGGVIGYPITPSTEISEIYEAARAEGGLNVWGKHAFFFEPEGEHSAQSGALGAALTGGQFISNASSSQGILYAMESHYVTVGKKIGGFVLQVAARVVSKHSLNVMAGHDDVYALLSSGYTVLFGANPQEAADLAAISYRASALSLIPVANCMDGFSTSHMLSEAVMPEPELLREYLGDPDGRIPSPTVAQDLVYGAKGRVYQLKQYLLRHHDDITTDAIATIETYLDQNAARIEPDYAGDLIGETLAWIPQELHGPWRRQWINAHEAGTRQMVPALVDVNNPGLTGPVQNQPDFQAGAVDHRTHFANAVPDLVREAMRDYSELTGREYTPIHTYDCEDADYVMVGLGSVVDDVQAVLPYLRKQGMKVGLVAVKLLQPFPEAELVAALAGKKAVTVLERSDQTALTSLVTQALFKANANANSLQYADIPAVSTLPRVTTAIFGLGGHDLQPRHLIAAFKAMDAPARNGGSSAPLVYLGSQFFSENTSPQMTEIQSRLRAAYPETELMALETEDNPRLLPAEAMRIRFHSVGGYGTIATGKLLTDILAGALGMNSKSAPKYGSEKSGAPTNYYITLSPEPVKITNAELEEVEIVISPDHKAFAHTSPLKGLVEGGTFIMQSNLTPLEAWKDLPASARETIRSKKIKFFVIDAFSVAKAHAPEPALETRMMGIAFIGAVAGNVDRVAGDADRDAMARKVRQQIEKKFGSKGESVVEGNMAVIEDGIKQTVRVDYDDPELAAVDANTRTMLPIRTVALSASMCECSGSSGCNGLFDRDYYDEMTMIPFKEGTIGEAPVLPGIGLFIPAGTAASKDKGLFRRSVPEFQAELCTGCMECTLVCPDAAIPNTVHEIHDLLLTAIKSVPVTGAQQDALRNSVFALTEWIRGWYREHKEDLEFFEVVTKAIEGVAIDDAMLRRNLGKMVEELSTFSVARTRPFFDAMEAQAPGSGGLFSATVDPWKCTGCLECVDVCGPGALVAREQDAPLLDMVQQRFEFMSKTPNTPNRFFEGSTDPDGEIKRLMLDRGNYYATTGGHGGCRGCGEVTAIRLVMASSHALGDKRRKAHTKELESLTDQLRDKLAGMNGNVAQRERVREILDTLERRLYLYEGGPTGQGPASTIVANATGCSSVYASTMPYNPYNDPWVNSLFQDAQPLAKGIFEGVCSQQAGDIKALRLAKLVLDDVYDPAVHDEQLRMLSWSNFTPAEMTLLPTVMTIGGDGATYDIGFGALSRVLASQTPIKVLVLNTGAYSNTGGQASTSSFTAQDSDLARVGSVHSGKQETRKELGLIASFHPNVFVCSTSPGVQGHYLKNTMEFLTYTEGPALMDVYTPCQGEHGIPDDSASRSARLAVESRMNPVFVHDPRRGITLHDWFSLDGNPDPGQTWSTTTLEYTNDEGALQLLDVALTPAYFAVNEGRFRKHYHPLSAQAEAIAVPVEQFIDLPAGQRTGQIPFIYAVNTDKKLVKLEVGLPIVALVEERRRNWQMMQYLSGMHLASLTAIHQADVLALQTQFEESTKARESSLDDIARAMSELAASSRAPASMSVGLGSAIGMRPGSGTAAASSGAGTATAVAEESALVRITDPELCTDCGTCYQELPQLFEKTKQVIDGEARQIAQVIPGAADKIEVTPELEKRIERVKATCDAEIIR